MIEHPVITETERCGGVYEDEFCRCSDCGASIRDDEYYWEIEDRIYCQDCAERLFRRLA